MFKRKKSLLAMAVLCAVAATSFTANPNAWAASPTQGEASENQEVSAAETAEKDLTEYAVEGVSVDGKQDTETTAEDSQPIEAADTLPGGFAKTTGEIGILGQKDTMDVPFSQMTLSRKTIDAFGGPNQPLQSILANNPAVRIQGTTLHNDFSIRGIKGNGTSSYLNGIPGLMTQFAAPTFMIDDIQFISGPNSGITGIPSTYETTSAGGIVNFVSKKAAEEPITRYKQTFSGRGSLGEYLDISRRFGENKEWGVRINTEWLDGETGIKENDMEARGIFVNIDHRDEKSKTNLLAGYRRLNIEGGARWFSLNQKNIGTQITKVPDAPDASNNYGFPGLVKESFGYLFALNHEQKMNDDWKWFLNAGLNRNKLERNIIGASSNFAIINDKGDVSNNLMSTQTETKNYYAQIGLNGQFATGEVEHDVTFALDKAWHSIGAAKNMYNDGSMGSVAGNIYDGIYGNKVWFPHIETALSTKDQYWGASLADTLKYKKSQLLLGVHKHSAKVDSYDRTTGRKKTTVESDAICPTYGYVYQPDEHVSLYASHSENFDKGTIVGSTYENVGQILDPVKTKQNEFGVKYENAGFLTSLGFFNIKQANNIDVSKGDKKYLLQDGEQEYKGIELSFNGRLSDKWNFMGGLMYLDAQQNRTQNGTNDGKTVNGVAKWNAVAALEYNADENFSVIGRAMYTGSAPLYNEQLDAPSYITYDLGVNYKTKWNDTPVTLSAMCYNITDKNYWTVYGNNLILSSPRTFVLSATFDI